MTGRYTIKEPLKKLFGDVITVEDSPALIIGDSHCPYQNKALLMSAFEIAKERGVKQLIHGGDVLDGAAYNSQAKNEIVPTTQTEIEHGRSVLYTAASYFEKIYIIPGNHDAYHFKKEKLTFDVYIREVIMENKFSKKVITTDYDYLYYDDFAVIGHLTQGYDMIAGKIAAQLALKYERHCLVAHDHRHGYMTAENGKYGISIGGMFMHDHFAYKSKAYNVFPNNQLGFVIIQDRHISMFDEWLNEKVVV